MVGIIGREYEAVVNALIVGFGGKNKMLSVLEYYGTPDEEYDLDGLSEWVDDNFPRI